MTGRGVHFRQALLPSGWASGVRVEIARGVITAVSSGMSPQPGDGTHAIGLPGMPNLHSHAFQRAMAGLAEVSGPLNDSFWSWRDIMYRFVERLDPRSLQAIAALAYMEMLETGFTRVGEFHYLHHAADGSRYDDPAELSQAIFAAAEETGIAITHLPVFYAHGGFGGADPSQAQRRFLNDLDSYAKLVEAVRSPSASLPDAIIGIAPHSLRAVTTAELQALDGLADGAPVHIHIAEQTREVDDSLAWSGQRPVEWLMAHARVDERWCLVHATHVTGTELRAIAASRAVVGLCPVTEANLGDGIFPGAAFRGEGGRFGIGSDSNVMIDMAEELRWLEYGQRLALRARNVLETGEGRSTGQAIYSAALAGGGQALGCGTGLAVGQSADMLALDEGHPSLAGRTADAIMDAFVFAAGRQAIDTVWRRGAVVVRQGRHVERDRIVARYRSALGSLLA